MFKGTTKIELTDVKTGKKEIYQHENMVTNAVNDILSLNPTGFKSMLTDNSLLFPIVPKLIGGILLCEKPLEEDPAKYWVPNDNPIVGYSGYSVSTENDPKRGSLNQLESGKLDDGSGYRFVFDFATSQGNGLISALGLTSDFGGSNGYGNLVTTDNGIKQYLDRRVEQEETSYSLTEFNERGCHLGDIVMLCPEENLAVAVWKSAANTLVVRKMKPALSSLGLFDDPKLLPCDNEYNDRTVFTENFASSVSEGGYLAFVNGEDGCIWGFEHSAGAYGNESGDASVNWVKINLSDYSIEEGTWVLDAQLMFFGQQGKNSSQSTRITNCVVHNGYLYCVNYTKTGVYKIELSNITNITFMEHPDGQVVAKPYTASGGYDYCGTTFNLMYDTVYFANGYIEGDRIVSTAYSNTESNYSNSTPHFSPAKPYGLRKTGKPGLRIGPFLMLSGYWRAASSDFYNGFSVALLSNYLATINNLMEPVEKTAEKTMKITYILRMIPEVIPEEETE